MKLLLFILLAGLVSCTSSYNVKLLKTGATIKAYDYDERHFKVGDTICIDAPSFYGDRWSINTNGSMTDTIYTYRSSSDSNRYYIFEQRIGVIKGKD